MNKYKKWTIGMISATLAFLVLFGLGTYITDPLLRYRKESGLFSYWHYTEIYSNPGVARQYDYDSVLVGSSMVEKTNVEQVGKIWDCSLVNLPYSGGTAYNMKTILDICFENNSDIKNVYWSLDEYALTVDPDTPRYPLPEYLYKEDHLDDLSYLLNADVFYFYTVKNILGTLRGESKLAMPLNPPESIDYSLYGKEKLCAGKRKGTGKGRLLPQAGKRKPGTEYPSASQSASKNDLPFFPAAVQYYLLAERIARGNA